MLFFDSVLLSSDVIPPPFIACICTLSANVCFCCSVVVFVDSLV